jgi:hypothetical protein
MEHFLDVYTKLLIAIISFVAPLIIYLLSVNSDGIVIVRDKANEEKKQLEEILREQMNSGNAFDGIIEESNRSLTKTNKNITRKSNLLNPKRQILRIFLSLFLALVFLMFWMLLKDSLIFNYSKTLSIIFLLSSFAFEIIGILILRQVTWAVIETKEEVAQKTREKELQKEQKIINSPIT